MSETSNKGPIFDPGECRCCGSTKKCRLLTAEYQFLGQKEVYSDMFVDTFGLLLSHLDSLESDRLICATCVLRLRDAGAFRQQVLNCEQKLLERLMNSNDVAEDPSISEIKTEIDAECNYKEDLPNRTANEPEITSEHDSHAYDVNVEEMDDDSDNIPISQVLVKNKVFKKVKTKKKIKTKTKKSPENNQKTKEKKIKKVKNLRTKLVRSIAKIDRHPESRQKTDENKQALENTFVIVENSYVCPFDTSFSDYYCFYCREIYTDPEKLRQHTLNHDPKTFKEVSANYYMKKTPQIDITRINCRLCSETIGDVEKLKSHLTISHGKVMNSIQNEFLKFKLTANNLSCIECGAIFKFFHALKKHMAEHFGSCTCDVCGAHYYDERMLLLHKKTHQKVDENFPCKDCGKIFKAKHTRLMHETKVHKKEPAYQCPKCDMVFFSYDLRYRHLIESHGEQRLFSCDNCDRVYDSRKSLREHNRRVHLKVYHHQCDLCDKRFYLPSRLREHMATHTGERNFRCEYCGKSYPRLRGLKVHMQSHTNDKKFKCHLCHAAFTQNVNLKNHVKRQHENVEEGVVPLIL